MQATAIAPDPTPADAASTAPRDPTQAELDAYAAQGWLRWGPLLTPDEVVVLRAEYDRVFDEAMAAGSYRNLSAGDGRDEATKRAHPRQMLQIMQLCERSLAFRRLIHDDHILRVVRALIGPNVMLFHDQALYKRPRSGGAVAWHQDNGYWRCAPANLVSCWLTLDDADEANGAMQVVSGSHLAPQRHATSAETTALLQVDTPDPERVTVVPVPAGGAMFHHCQTLHYTAPNDTNRPRRAFAIHCMPFGTRDSAGKVMRASWERPVLSMDM